MPQIENLVDKLATRLPSEGVRPLDAVRSSAESSGLRAFLVGGTVRDLLLERDSLDIDVVIEGDAVQLARDVAMQTGARLAKTTAFGTATLKDGAFSLDLATARAESYARPGALPMVTPSTIDADLLRRDFTINAIALQITSPAPGKLLDPTGGVADLRAGLIRVLHDQSFQDDATRIIRAARYEARFGFRIEECTQDLLCRDLAALNAISGTRIRQELARTFAEDQPERALARLQEFGVFQAIHPSLSFGNAQTRAVRLLHEIGAPALAIWPLLAWATDAAQLPDVIRRLALTRVQAAALTALPAARSVEGRLAAVSRPSEMTHLLDPIALPAVYALAAITGDEAVISYLTTWRNARPILRGDELFEIGVARGPDVASVLSLLRAAKLDGEVISRADEEHLVDEFLARERLGLA